MRILEADSDLLAVWFQVWWRVVTVYLQTMTPWTKFVTSTTGNNVLLQTDGVGTVDAQSTYIPQAHAQVINVAILRRRDEPCFLHAMMTRLLASLASC